jgi:hypothetical protein
MRVMDGPTAYVQLKAGEIANAITIVRIPAITARSNSSRDRIQLA